MICFTTAVLCRSPVEANILLLLLSALCTFSNYRLKFSRDAINAAIQMIFDPQVVKKYIQQSILEKELLYFGYEAFGITFVDPVSEQTICYHCIWPT